MCSRGKGLRDCGKTSGSKNCCGQEAQGNTANFLKDRRDASAGGTVTEKPGDQTTQASHDEDLEL